MPKTYEKKVRDLQSFGFKKVYGCQYHQGQKVVITPTGIDDPKVACSYVGLLDDGTTLKTGIAGAGALGRWKKTFRVVEDGLPNRSLRNNEKEDGKKIREHWNTQTLEIWVKPALKVKIPYASETMEFSAHHAEEDFLDSYFEPVFGRKLETRKQLGKKPR